MVNPELLTPAECERFQRFLRYQIECTKKTMHQMTADRIAATEEYRASEQGQADYIVLTRLIKSIGHLQALVEDLPRWVEA